MQSANGLQIWVSRLDRRVYALLVGAAVGLIAGLLGLLLAIADPVVAIGGVLGMLAGLFMLTNISLALYGIVAVLALLPFGTLPFRIGFTPTLLDSAIGAFLIVYMLQWMTGRRHQFRLTPVHALIALYWLWLVLSFILGLRHGALTPSVLNQFAQTLLSVGLTFVLVDVLRDTRMLRRLALALMIGVSVQALVALSLYILPDVAAERTLVRLARIGYPNGGVIRYIEDNPALDERAIGTWIDPNTLGGVLAIGAVLIAPQILARQPALRPRGLALLALSLTGLALALTYSRASLLAFGAGLALIAWFRPYRLYGLALLLAGTALLFLPQTQGLVERFAAAFTGSDLATQMRLGEYSDSLRLIARYPITGVGFTGTPEIDIYTDVASMYLIMANQIGLVGVSIFALTMGAVAVYSAAAWRQARARPDLQAIHLGLHAALLAGLINAAADLYFFRIDFQASITLFWLMVALALASSRLMMDESTVAKTI